MKRVLRVLLVALIVPVLLIPAHAGTGYVFERFDPDSIMLFGSFDFTAYPADHVFVYEGILADGLYTVSFVSESGSAGSLDSLGPFQVVFLYDENEDLWYSSSVLSIPMLDSSGSVVGYVDAALVFAIFDGTTVSFLELGGSLADVDAYSYMTLTPVGSDPVPSLVDYVSADSMSAVLSEIVALLPVILTVLVGYVAVRKGISWIHGFISKT